MASEPKPQPQFEFVRSVRIAGMKYTPGDPFDPVALEMPDHKVQQFLRQRIIRPVPGSNFPVIDNS